MTSLPLLLAVSTLVLALAGTASLFAVRRDMQVVSASRVPSKAMGVVVGTHWAGNGAVARPPVIGLSTASSPTCPALSLSSFVNPKIGATQRMAVDAMCLSRLMGCWRLATQQVSPMCHRFQMPRVAARSVAAKVVDFETLGNSADENLVGRAMSLDAAAVIGRAAVSSVGGAAAWIRPAGFKITTTNGRGQVSSEDRFAHSGIYNRWTPKTRHGGKP